MDIFINKKIWNTFTEEELKDYEQQCFDYYRNKGFPYFPTDMKYREAELKKFLNTNHRKLYNNNIIGQHMAGLSFCWSYMPHSFNVVCNDLKTPLEVFNNDELFKKVIHKRIKYGDNMSDNGIRKMLKIFTGTQCVSNFRPTASAVIYDLFAKDGIVWDMSAGYGGRMLGAIKAGVKKYIATDPCTETYNGLMEMINDFPILTKHTQIELHKIGSEDFIPNEVVDLCFTSPPYFNTEKYSNEETQSWIKYPTKEKWLNEFMSKTLLNCYKSLKSEGILALNIANVKSYPNMEEDIIKLAHDIGFNLIDCIKYALSSISHNDKYKYEPIYIFKK